MNPLKIGISGVRGIVGETFTPHVAVQFTEAFATYAGRGRLLVCDDARPSGEMVRGAVIAGLLSAGCEPVDMGICPVPRMQYAVARSDAVGGIAVSAGHNPEDWNALKFIRGDGFYLNARESDELLDVYHRGEFLKAAWNEILPLKRRDGDGGSHLGAILSAVDAKKIKKLKPRVAVDACNGACSAAAAELLEALGCNAVLINNEPGEPFPHDPEPNAANMRQLRALVGAAECDAGFMLDTAGERLGIVTDAAAVMTEDGTLALCVELMLRRRRGPVVTNLSTTLAIDDIAKKYKCRVHRTQIGQSHVAEAARKQSAVIAGEGSGGVILPEVHYASDALAAIAFVLDGLARERRKLSALAAELPQYVTLKKKVQLDYALIYRSIHRARQAAVSEVKKSRLDLSDGVKLEWGASWLHIRPSNTESLIRIIAEARTERRARDLIELGEELIGV